MLILLQSSCEQVTAKLSERETKYREKSVKVPSHTTYTRVEFCAPSDKRASARRLHYTYLEQDARLLHLHADHNALTAERAGSCTCLPLLPADFATSATAALPASLPTCRRALLNARQSTWLHPNMRVRVRVLVQSDEVRGCF